MNPVVVMGVGGKIFLITYKVIMEHQAGTQGPVWKELSVGGTDYEREEQEVYWRAVPDTLPLCDLSENLFIKDHLAVHCTTS